MSDKKTMSERRRMAAALNTLGFRLMTELAGKLPGKNLFISPMSIALALAMTYNGARGETQAEIARVLGIEGMNLQDANAAFADLQALQNTLDPKVRLAIANALFASPEEVLREDFVNACREVYAAEARNIDFGDPARAADEINAWVEHKAEQMIKNLVTPIDLVLARLVLVNAIYFKGAWSDPFDPQRTRDGDFRLLSGETRPMPMMAQSGEMAAYEDDALQAVSLPYGEGGVSMMIVLPRPESDFAAFRARLDAGALETLAGRLKPVQGEVRLPRFKVAFGAHSLKDALKALGMERAFGAADFSGMAQTGLFISDVLHKAVMEVNEEGTTAAAATAVIMARGMPIARRFRMVVDRPFFCAIRDQVTGLALFTGWIVEPEALS
jgi:serpin B